MTISVDVARSIHRSGQLDECDIPGMEAIEKLPDEGVC